MQQMNNRALSAQNIDYQGKLSQTQYQNASNAATYQGKLAAYQSEVQQSQSMGNLFKNAFSLFTG